MSKLRTRDNSPGRKSFIVIMLLVVLWVSTMPLGIQFALAATGDELGAQEVGVILDDQDPGVTYTGLAPLPSTQNFIQQASGAYKGKFTYFNVNKSAPQSMTFTPEVPEDGLYDFYVRKPGTTRWYNGNVPYTITHESGASVINNPSSGNGTEQWVKYGTFPLRSGQTYSIIAGGAGYQSFPPVAPGANGAISAAVDGIKLIKSAPYPDQAGLNTLKLSNDAAMTVAMNKWSVDLEKVKYEAAATISGSTTVGTDVHSQVLHLKSGQTSNAAIQVTPLTPVNGTYLKIADSKLLLKARNQTAENAIENATIKLSSGGESATITVAVTIAPSAAPEEAGGEGNFTDTPTWYREYAPGIFNPNEGTIELKLRLDKPYKEFGNTWDFLFKLIPAQSGPGNTLIAAHIPPPLSKPSGPNPAFEQPLTFFARNGVGSAGAYTSAKPEQIQYAIGQPFNLAFSWKMGAGGYAAIYKDGVQISSASPSTAAAIMEKFMPYEFMVERASPFNISEVKVSTKALDASKLEHTAESFSVGTDTALLADITYGQDIQTQKFVTPWHTASQYSVVKPAFRNEKQVFYAGEDAVYPVMTVNYGNSAKDYQVTIKATDPSGQVTFTKEYPLQVAPGGEYRMVELALTQLANKVGYWYLEATVSTGGSEPIVYKSGISKVPAGEAGVADGKYANYYGQHANYDYDMSAWTKIHTSATRGWEGALQFLWYAVEPTKGNFVWDKSDAYVEKAQEAGLDILAVLGYPSDWASSRPSPQDIDAGMTDLAYRAERWVPKDIKFTNDVPGTGADWSNYVYQTMKRYAGKVKYWEIINEVNFHPPATLAAFSGTKEEYILMQKLAYEQAQRVKTEYKQATGNDLELYVTTSGFATPTPAADRQLAIDMLNGDNPDYYDYYNIHGYEGIQGIKDVMAAYTAAKAKYPNLQLWQSESYPHLISQTSRRVYNTVWNYMDFLAAGTSKYFNMGTPADDTFVTRHSQSPTEVYQVMAIMQHHIRKAETYVGAYTGIQNGNLLTVNHYLKRTDNNYLSVFASEEETPLYLTIENADQIISAQDAYGNPVLAEDFEGTKRLLKANSLFIVSQAPLQIKKVSGNVNPALIKNGDFEWTTGDSTGGTSSLLLSHWNMGWNRGVYGTNAYVTMTDHYEGDKALAFNSAGSPNNRTFMTQSFTVTAPGTYVLSAYIKKLEGADVQPELNLWDGTNDHQLAPVALTNEYKKYSFTYEVEAPHTFIVNVGILSGVGKVVFDQVSFEQIPENDSITMDDSNSSGVTLIGSWVKGNNDDANEKNYVVNATKDGASRVIYKPDIRLDGLYDVYVWQHHTSGTSDAPFTIQHASGTDTVLVNQSKNGKQWFKIGSYPFLKGNSGSVTVRNAFTQGSFILADGVRFTRTGPLPTENEPMKNKLTGPAIVNGKEDFTVRYGLEQVTGSVYAVDAMLTFDPTKLDFIKAVSAKQGFEIFSTQTIVPGKIRLVAASKGSASAINSPADVLAITFRAKAGNTGGETDIQAVSVTADGEGTETTLTASVYTVNVQIVDKTKLNTAIADAEALYQGSVEGTAIGQYPAHARAALQAAINAAKLVQAEPAANQANIDTAADTLQVAMTTFWQAIVTRQPEDVNGDNRISIGDLALVAAHYSKTSESSDWSLVRLCDVNGDGRIDFLDMVSIALKMQ